MPVVPAVPLAAVPVFLPPPPAPNPPDVEAPPDWESPPFDIGLVSKERRKRLRASEGPPPACKVFFGDYDKDNALESYIRNEIAEIKEEDETLNPTGLNASSVPLSEGDEVPSPVKPETSAERAHRFRTSVKLVFSQPRDLIVDQRAATQAWSERLFYTVLTWFNTEKTLFVLDGEDFSSVQSVDDAKETLVALPGRAIGKFIHELQGKPAATFKWHRKKYVVPKCISVYQELYTCVVKTSIYPEIAEHLLHNEVSLREGGVVYYDGAVNAVLYGKLEMLLRSFPDRLEYLKNEAIYNNTLLYVMNRLILRTRYLLGGCPQRIQVPLNSNKPDSKEPPKSGRSIDGV